MHQPGSPEVGSVSCSLACIELPAFPLQILLHQRPEWRTSQAAVVVVDEDRPQGVITHLNGAARRAGILPGQRYAEALGLMREVRAGVVPPGVVGAGLAQVLSLLRAFSPNIEPSDDEPGLFWVDVSGLGGLYDTLLSWAQQVSEGLAREGFSALVALGFSRFGTYAGVKSLAHERATHDHPGPSRDLPLLAERIRVMTTPRAERTLALQVPLGYLALSTGVRDRLDRLGVRTLGELMALPAAGVMKRWGPEAHALHHLAQGLAGDVSGLPGLADRMGARLHPTPEVQPARAHALLDFLEHDAHRLLFRIKSLLDEVLSILRERQALVAELVLVLGFEAPQRGASACATRFGQHRIRPAAPTLDAALLLDLLRLRLESVDLTSGLSELSLEVLETPASPEQMRLFSLGPHQDGAAAARALARIQAELGQALVGTMALRDAHLPRARQAFVPLVFDHRKRALPAPRMGHVPPEPPLIRRLHPRPEPMPVRLRDPRNDGWQTRDPAQGTIVLMHGPFIIAGGWWLGAPAKRPGELPMSPAALGEGSEVHREYAFVETQRGDLLWIYHDRRRRHWFEEGRVE